MRNQALRKTFAASVIAISTFSLAQSGKVEALGANTDAAVSDAVKKVLASKGHRLILDDSSVACEIWLRESVPAQAKKDVPGALYPQLAESSLVGVVSFPKATNDYRGEAIKAGTYTLRYALLPNDGAHMGVAPNRDFLLLIPSGSDPDPNAVFKFAELVGLSRKATGAQHPGPLALVFAEGGTAPAFVKDQEEHWVFSAGTKLASGVDLPIALVVKGTVAQ